ncbi:SpaA isopeptide-forming pilin-related protein [Enterococcus sp. AZ196]|uniref:SpaA isopeptide-forming pilin-related protein n=1 Tax=Enterococcus sp. AZ196 TaxID=2774659 RepID=UPI003D2A39F9
MKEYLKSKRFFSFLFLILILITILVFQFPKGELLRAFTSEKFVDIAIDGEATTDDVLKINSKTVELVLKAKKDIILEIPYEGDVSIHPLDKENEEMSIEQFSSNDFKKEDLINEQNNLDNKESKKNRTCLRVIKNDSSGSIFIIFKKDDVQKLKIQRNTTEEVELEAIDVKKSDGMQTILKFEKIKKQLHSIPEEVQTTKKSTEVDTKTSESNITVTETKEEKSEISKNDINSTETRQESERNHNADKPSKAEIAAKSNIPTQSMEKEENNQKEPVVTRKFEVEKGEKIVTVPTTNTKMSLKELENKEYKKGDYLRSPVLLMDEKGKVNAESTNDTIVIRDARIVTKTGTDDFDSDDLPGHDSGPGTPEKPNDIVRTFDQILYFVSFSIQNSSSKTKYSNIRYRVTGKFQGALKNIDGTLVNVGEISNGENYDLSSGEQYSEGVMESVISDTGQVFVPIALNVFAPKHGTEILPEFKLEIVEAKNEETGEVEVFNKSYDDKKLQNLKVPITKVSAKPSISIELVAGETSDRNIFSPSSAITSEAAYDVAAITTLKPLDGKNRDFRGTTFPSGPIEYEIKQSGTYKTSANIEKSMTPGTHYDPMLVETYSPAMKNRSKGQWKTVSGGRTIDPTKFKRALAAPHGKTFSIYNSEPSVEDKSEIGVFDAGNFSINRATGTQNAVVINTDFAGTYNPYTYLMTGARSPDATAKRFSSLELVYSWNSAKSDKISLAEKWNYYTMSLTVDSVSYEGKSYKNSSTIKYPFATTPPGGFAAMQTFMQEQFAGEYGVPGTTVRFSNATPNKERITNYGLGELYQGTRAWLYNWCKISGAQVNKVSGSDHLTMWDPECFEYDDSLVPYYNYVWSTKNHETEVRYGIAKKDENKMVGPYTKETPPFTRKLRHIEKDSQFYNWYKTADEARSHGKISAVKYFGKYDHDPNQSGAEARLEKGYVTPVKILGGAGTKTPSGYPIVNVGSSRFLDKDGVEMFDSVTTGSESATGGGSKTGVGTYANSTWDAKGNPTFVHAVFNHLGDTAFIKPMSITTKTEVEKSTYNSKDEVNIKVQGVLSAKTDNKLDSALVVKLPLGVKFKKGSSTDSKGKPLTDPHITTDSNGIQTLKWIVPDVTAARGPEVNFISNIDQSKLTFLESGFTDNLTINTYGELWVSSNENSRDNSDIRLRSSSDYFNVQHMQQNTLSKSVNKPFIEVGNNDPRPSKEDTSITYEVSLINDSTSGIVDGRLLDILPYDNDFRGTNFHGDYTVTDIKVTGPSSTISFSKSSIKEENPDPKNPGLSDWETYKPGVDTKEKIEDAKTIMVSTPIINRTEEVKLTITIQPKGQKAGDTFVNDAIMNSKIDLPVKSQAVWTRVYGRDLTGYVWYDDNYNGLIDPSENPVGNIPVKLYRTSLKDLSFEKKLVTENLSGEKFIDSKTGYSNIKTSTDGKYTFNDLPEGNYVAEFVIENIVITKKIAIVTKKWVGTDPKLNSKVNPDDFTTPSDFKNPNDGTSYFNHPKLADLPEKLAAGEFIYSISHVNAGLTRLSKLRVFKYEEGSVVDANDDGELSGAEIENNQTHALEGAKFVIYKGENNTDPDDKIGEATTDEHGWLEFHGLHKGEYTLVELKAPPGFELLKNPINVIISSYNSVAIVHVPDKGQSKLPFTGGTKTMQIILIASVCLLVIGMIGVFMHFHPVKIRRGRIK